MNKFLTICALLTFSGVMAAPAAEFPLKFKTIEPQKVMDFPGGYGCFGRLKLVKPDEIKKEPPVVSKYPLYGNFQNLNISFRLDESKGNEKGYDQLIVDINENGDLTDDPVIKLTDSQKGSRSLFFGPLELPKEKAICGGCPVYYFQSYICVQNLKNIENLSEQQKETFYCGQLRMRAAWYLEADVTLGNIKEKIGVIDGDGNFSLGDFPVNHEYENDGVKKWYFSGGDNYLIDANGNGKFDNDLFSSEFKAFGPVFYFDTVPYKATLAKDFTSIKIEKWSDPLAEVSIHPYGEQVGIVNLVRQVSSNRWELIQTSVEKGKIKVPPGKYRLISCCIMTKRDDGEPIGMKGYLRDEKTPFEFEVGKSNSFECGAPLKISLEANKRKPESYEETRLKPKEKDDSDFILSVNSTIIGQGGEQYSVYGKGPQYTSSLDNPSLTISDASGQKLETGKMEYG